VVSIVAFSQTSFAAQKGRLQVQNQRRRPIEIVFLVVE
jgi:hypothetical protein